MHVAIVRSEKGLCTEIYMVDNHVIPIESVEKAFKKDWKKCLNKVKRRSTIWIPQDIITEMGKNYWKILAVTHKSMVAVEY
jgi:hypothetical protein